MYYFAITLLLVCSIGLADETEFTVPKSMALGVHYLSIDAASIEQSQYDVEIDQTRIKLPIGKYTLLDNTFVPQIAVEETVFKVASPEIDGRAEMYSIKTPFMFIEKYDDHWTRILNITPSWHTDLKARDEESYSLMGLLLWRYGDNASPHSYTFGVGVNRLFGEYKPVPMIAYSYQTSPYTRYDLGFPVTKVEHRFHQQWTWFSAIGPMGGNWRYEENITNTRVNLSYKSWIATLGIRRQLKDNIWLTFELGQSFARSLDFNSDNFASKEADIDDASMFKFSLGLHP